ncbi:CCA tRNA nucleotidyltransferase [Halovenus marina]|uniref:CCA tRNA nucleotidyltransferase n=1 Tax=Halovenus marina TaxID=3396621 RepID=UPI003F57FA30
MSDSLESVLDRVRERVRPDDDERERLQGAVEDLRTRTEAAIEAELPVDASVIQVGSTARDTWLSGDRDIDLFVAFDPDLDRNQLEEFGLAVGHAVLPDGREEFAEHPYVVGEYDGFEVDLVPCYDLETATDIRSAVDRTPFHSQYIDARLDADLAGDVRVCKQFFTAIGVYGSDLRTKGFSGFLTELLVLEHGGFRPLVEAAADWHPRVRFDPEDHGTATFDDPLVVIDPTDPARNVAAVLSATNLARLQHFARELLADPRDSLFERPEPDPLSEAAVRERFNERATTPVALQFETPDIVDDQLWPQLERSQSGVAGELDRRGFDVFRSAAVATDERSALLFELSVAERPRVERHEGPPVHVREHAEAFLDAYRDGDADGPFIDGDRYVVEREREFRTAQSLLESDELFRVSLGVEIEAALADEYQVLVGDEVAALADDFAVELTRYLDPSPRGP